MFNDKIELIKKLEKQIEDLKREIKEEKKTNLISKLKLACHKYDSFSSKNGRTWWRFPKKSTDDVYCSEWFLTDLQDNYISDKVYYEGHKCKPGWAVDAYYCRDEFEAINCFEDKYLKTK